jgi:hypothetical protein
MSAVQYRALTVPADCESVTELGPFENYTAQRVPNKQHEWKFQKAMATMLRHEMPADVPWWANEDFGHMEPRIARYLKDRGCRPGKPDFTFEPPHRLDFHIELKIGKNGLTDSQKKLFPLIEATGRTIHICRTEQQVRDALAAENIKLFRRF